MRGTTCKMLRRYSGGVGMSFDSAKAWWKRLSAPRRAVMSARIRGEMTRAKAEGRA